MFDITVTWSTKNGGTKKISKVSRSMADAIRLMQMEDATLIFPHSAIKVPVGRS